MRNNRGFTIIELMATMIIVTIGVVGAYSVVQQILAITSSASQRLTAAYLAQEGIELVRNIRDTNWVEGSAWNQGPRRAGRQRRIGARLSEAAGVRSHGPAGRRWDGFGLARHSARHAARRGAQADRPTGGSVSQRPTAV